MSDIQLHRYNIATIELMKQLYAAWGEASSTVERPVRPYFISLSFRAMEPERRRFFNSIPTSFALSDEQVDALIAAGGGLLRDNAEFQRFLSDARR